MAELTYIGGLSGGIDSQAAAHVVLVNSDAGGNEHPLTVEHIGWYSKHVPAGGLGRAA